MSKDINVESINELIKDYKYGQYNIIEKDIKIYCNPKTKETKIENFFDHDKFLRTGSCSELMNTAYMELKIIHPEYYIFRSTGKEPQFYHGKKATHCFLLVLKDNPFLQYANTKESKRKIKEYIIQNAFVVDPCFKKILKFSESQYIVTATAAETEGVDHSNDVILTHKQTTNKEKTTAKETSTNVPLMYNPIKNALIGLQTNFNNESKLEISFKIYKENFAVDIESETIDKLINHKESHKPTIDIFKKLRETPRIITYDTLEAPIHHTTF
jgi:hypothetical protein